MRLVSKKMGLKMTMCQQYGSSIFDPEKLPLNTTRGIPENIQRLSSILIGCTLRGMA